jgi:hypothetical protein
MTTSAIFTTIHSRWFTVATINLDGKHLGDGVASPWDSTGALVW